MTCRVCRHDFCWLCSGKWKGHTNCNSVRDYVIAIVRGLIVLLVFRAMDVTSYCFFDILYLVVHYEVLVFYHAL